MRWILVLALLSACGDDDGGGTDAAAEDGGFDDVGVDDSGSEDAGDDDAGGEDAALDAPAVDTGPPEEMVFMEVDGLVAIEAEHFSANIAGGLPRAWYLTTPSVTPEVAPDPDPNHAEGSSGDAYLEGLPDTRVTDEDPLVNGESFFNNGGEGPELQYRVVFTTPGTYYVWARAYSTGGEDNGIHVGIDGDWPDSGRRLQWCSGKNQWTWSSAQRDSGGSACGIPNTITIDVPDAGEHTITFSMREDGFEFDKLVLVQDADFVPTDTGPDERLAM